MTASSSAPGPDFQGDIHQWTADNDPEFHHFMAMLYGDGWRGKFSLRLIRQFAKGYTFSKLYGAPLPKDLK